MILLLLLLILLQEGQNASHAKVHEDRSNRCRYTAM